MRGREEEPHSLRESNEVTAGEGNGGGGGVADLADKKRHAVRQRKVRKRKPSRQAWLGLKILSVT